jgi:hypothetical protein
LKRKSKYYDKYSGIPPVYRFLLFFYTSESPKFSSIADVICTSVRLKVMARNLQNLGLPKSEGYPT